MEKPKLSLNSYEPLGRNGSVFLSICYGLLGRRLLANPLHSARVEWLESDGL